MGQLAKKTMAIQSIITINSYNSDNIYLIKEDDKCEFIEKIMN